MTRYAWYMSQVPVIIGHLRDSMLPIQATSYDTTKVSGTREQPLPFRIEPMEDADDLWAALVAYGNAIARHIQPAPHALSTRLRASTQWYEAGEAAYTITAWLVYHEDRIASLELIELYRDETDVALFGSIGQLLAKYRITPNRLRSYTRECRVCGEAAVYAEWALGRDGDVGNTEQCTVCHERYEPASLPTRTEVLALWTDLDLEEVTDDPTHLLAGSTPRQAIGGHDQAVA